MRTFEYSINPEAVAQDGMATVVSLCGFAVNAAHRTMIEEGYGDCLLSRCTFELDERPLAGEYINIRVNSWLNNIVTLLNKDVLITDNEGIEIGRCRIEWTMPNASRKGLVSENPSRLTRRFIKKFHEILPDKGAYTGLQFRIDMDFRGEDSKAGDISVAFKKICDSRFFFLARSGSDTLCRAMLQTA